jgi:excisionase family DNA binding protein
MDATLPPTAPAPQGLGTIKDACAFLRISRVSVYQHTRQGNLAAVKLGRAVRYSWLELERAAREGLPPLKKAPAPAAQTDQGATDGKRRRGRPRKSSAIGGAA